MWTGLQRPGSDYSANDFVTLPDGKRILISQISQFCRREPDNFQSIQHCVDYNRDRGCLSDFGCYQSYQASICEIAVCSARDAKVPNLPYTRCSRGSWYVSADRSERLVCYAGTTTVSNIVLVFFTINFDSSDVQHLFSDLYTTVELF